MEATFFETPADFRRWLDEHHASADELWVGFRRKATGLPSITYPEAVDEALCFGWIDGIRKSLDETSYVNRFTPRRRGSNWSAVNVKRVGELERAGRMRAAGRRAFAAREAARTASYSYENRPQGLEPELEAVFREDEPAWAYFAAQPPGYRRTAAWWVMSAKRDETRRRRLEALIAESGRGRRVAAVAGGAGQRSR